MLYWAELCHTNTATCIYQFATAAITQYHRLDRLNNRTVFSHSFRCWKYKITVLAELVSPEAFLLGLETAVFFPRPYMLFALCAHILCVSSSSYKETSLLNQGLTYMTFNPNYFLKSSISKYSHILKFQGLGLRSSTYEF